MTERNGANAVPGPAELSVAAARLAGKVRRTPTLDLPAGDVCSVPVTVKLETLQHTGSFKARGALNAVLTAPAGTSSITAAYGATLHRVDGFYADALAASLAHAEQHSAHHVDAYDAEAVVAGQSTLGPELTEQIEPGRPVLVSCGGGLFAGVSLPLDGRNPVVAVEPATAPL